MNFICMQIISSRCTLKMEKRKYGGCTKRCDFNISFNHNAHGFRRKECNIFAKITIPNGSDSKEYSTTGGPVIFHCKSIRLLSI